MSNVLEFKRPESESGIDPEVARKQQQEAAEVLHAKEEEAETASRRTWSTEGEMQELVEKTDKIWQKPEEVSSTQEIHTETGLRPADEEKLKKDPLAWIEETISKAELSPNEQLLGLSKAMEDKEA